MKKRNYTQLFILMTLVLSNGAMAQKFKKYKSKTKLNKNVGNTISDELDQINANPASAEEVDQFGRNKKNKKIKVNDKFVSLNPETAFGPEIVEKFEFEKANLTDLTKHMQKLTGINLILDKNTFDEIGKISGSSIYGDDGGLEDFTPANFLLGFGKINNRSIIIGGEDFTLKGGSPNAAGLRKSIYTEDLALKYKIPLIRLHEGGGGSVAGANNSKSQSNLPSSEPVFSKNRFQVQGGPPQ